MSNHTPEPWGPGTEIYLSAKAGEKFGPSIVYPQSHKQEICEANARRIVTCVNACAGMADPAAEIAELKQQRDELLAALGASIPLIKQARLDWCDQNAESYDEDVVTPYDAILYLPIISLLETKGPTS